MPYKDSAYRKDMNLQEFRREVCSPTDPRKVYVIAKTIIQWGVKRENRMYLTHSKGKGGAQYWGLYIGTDGKRYGATRFHGGTKLDKLLAMPGNRDLLAVEVNG